ncbi:MAG TPA: response regulator [Polyangiales bacterium]|nr:response regulator [Polyangiales bacterium]
MERTKAEFEARSDSAVRQVAIAEDDDELRSLLATMLRRAGYGVREFSSGSQLLKSLSGGDKQAALLSDTKLGVDLVISDIRMPGASGLDVLAKLHSAHRPVPVVLMTAFGDRTTHEQALQMGAAALIDKPFELDELLSLTDRLLTHH